MYHIKTDQRSQKSAALIYNTLLDCLQTKPFNQITVTDIHKSSFISRATFYRHFDNLVDVLYWRCNQCFAEVLSNYAPKKTLLEQDKYDFVGYFLGYWHSNGEIIELLISIGRLDIIYDCHINNMAVLFDKYSLQLTLSTVEYDYFNGIRSGIMIGILITWLKNKKKQSINELFIIITTQLDFLRTSNLFF